MSRTSIIGIITIASAVLNYALGMLNGHPTDLGLTITAITSGVAAIHSADQKK